MSATKMVSASQLTEAVLRKLVRAQSKSKSNDGRRQRSHQPISDGKVRTLTQTTLLAVFVVVWFITMPAAVFGHSDQSALRNVQDTREAHEKESASQIFTQLGSSNLFPATDGGELVVLSHGFEDNRFSSSIIGESQNLCQEWFTHPWAHPLRGIIHFKGQEVVLIPTILTIIVYRNYQRDHTGNCRT